MHLYELTDQMRGLQALIDEGTMDQETLDATLEGLEGDIQAKGKSTLAVLANLGAQADAYANEIKRMQARKKTIENHHAWLKEYLRTNMVKAGITKIESPVFTATLGKPGQKTEIVDKDLIPKIYQEVVPATIKIPIAPITKALKAGVDVPGCKLVDSQAPLRIR